MSKLFRYCRNLFVVALAVFVLLVITAPFVIPAVVRTHWAKSTLSSVIGDSLQRNVHLNGDLELGVSLHPKLHFSNFVIENPSTLNAKEMLRVGSLTISLPLFPNLFGSLQIGEINAENVFVHVAKDSSARLNWDFSDAPHDEKPEDDGTLVLPSLQKLTLKHFSLLLETGATPHRISFDSLVAQDINVKKTGNITSTIVVDDVPVHLKGDLSSLNKLFEGGSLEFALDLTQSTNHFKADGQFRENGTANVHVRASGEDLSSLSPLIGTELPPLKNYALRSTFVRTPSSKLDSLSLKDVHLEIADQKGHGEIELGIHQNGNLDLTGTIALGSHSLSAKGSLEKNGALVLDLSSSGDDLSKLSSVVLVDLPPLKQFSFESHITSPSVDQGKFDFNNVKLRIGDSDLSGTASFLSTPLTVNAQFESNNIDLSSLLPAMDSGEQKKVEQERPVQIPYQYFDLVKSEISLRAARLLPLPNLELHKVDIEAKIGDGMLSIPKLFAQTFGGSFDGSGNASKKAIQWKLKGKDLDVESISKLAGGTSSLEGDINLALDLIGTGEELPNILKTLSGSVSINSDNAVMKSSTLHSAASGLERILSPIFEDTNRAASECIVLDFDVKDGIARSEEQVIKLGEVFIFASGKIDLPKNELEYNFNVNSSNPALASLIPPFRAFGSLSNPHFVPSVSGSIASIADSGEKVVETAFHFADGATKLVLGNTDKKLTGLAVCKAAYAAEQKLLSSRFGKLIDGGAPAAKKMHASWDKDGDGINDCENDGSCDHTQDYSKPRPASEK